MKPAQQVELPTMRVEKTVERIEAFVRQRAEGDFSALAAEAFAFHFERLDAYKAMCERAGRTPATVDDWRQIPMIPTRAFKSLDLTNGETEVVFRSSGTTSETRSVHAHPFLSLYRATIETSFPTHCLPSEAPVPMLSLIPSRQQLPDSSLSFMIDHVITTWGDDASACAFGLRGIDGRLLRSWLAGRQRDKRPALVMTTAFALVEALEALERLGVRFRLPIGSVLFETGGYKGRSREFSSEDLAARTETWLGIAPQRVVREYGMTELTSQLYSRTLSGGATDLFVAPPWCRYRVLDPESLEEVAPGETGLIAILDLANLGSALHLLTEDLGVAEPDGLRLMGRAEGADLRGCSLTAEELAAGA
jgi:hypothetical protein